MINHRRGPGRSARGVRSIEDDLPVKESGHGQERVWREMVCEICKTKGKGGKRGGEGKKPGEGRSGELVG